MRTRIRILAPLALVVVATAACGSSGSSGTGGGSSSSAAGGSTAAAGGKACAPVAGDQLVVLKDDKALQSADNVLPAVNAKANTKNPALMPALEAVAAKITTDDLVNLNNAVDVQRKSVADAASGWVAAHDVTGGLAKGSGKIVVGSPGFTEGKVLGAIFADVLKKVGFDASAREVGSRDLYLKALIAGSEIQVVPEYLSTVTEAINKLPQVNGPSATPVASGDVQATFTALKPLAAKVGLVFGTPSAAADENAFAVTQALADKLKVTTLSELAAACSDGSLVLGGPTECPTRPFCQPGLEKTYSLKFASFKGLDAGGPLTKAAIAKGTVSIGLVFSSDGSLAKK
jgi:osmoprotectant transport system substrate-binding protein